MWRRRTHNLHPLLAALLALTLLASCNVHEWPEPPETDFYVDLEFDLSAMPIFKTVEYELLSSRRTRGARYNPLNDNPEIRYLIRAYALDADGEIADQQPQKTFLFTDDDIVDLDYRCRLALPPGDYRLMVWADYSTSRDDYYYDTQDFRNIYFTGGRENYVGSFGMKDAFIGRQDVTVGVNPDILTNDAANVKAHVDMGRPFGKYQFVTTDIPDFVGKYLGITNPEDFAKVDFTQYRVLVRYTGYLPTNFNLLTNKPFDAYTGYQFFSEISDVTPTEATLAYDYVFVNGHESSVSVAIGIYDRNGTLLSFSDPIEVPLIRNQLTIVRGRFLSQGGSGNIGIDPDFDGNYNIYIND